MGSPVRRSCVPAGSWFPAHWSTKFSIPPSPARRIHRSNTLPWTASPRSGRHTISATPPSAPIPPSNNRTPARVAHRAPAAPPHSGFRCLHQCRLRGDAPPPALDRRRTPAAPVPCVACGSDSRSAIAPRWTFSFGPYPALLVGLDQALGSIRDDFTNSPAGRDGLVSQGTHATKY